MTGRCRVLSALGLFVAGLLLARAALPAERFRFNQASARHQVDEPMAAKSFSSGILTLRIPLTDLHAPEIDKLEIRCAANAGIKGVRVDFLFKIFDHDRNLLGESSGRGRTGEDGWTPPIVVPQLIEGFPFGSLLSAVADPRGNKKTGEIEIECIYAPDTICIGSILPTCS